MPPSVDMRAAASRQVRTEMYLPSNTPLMQGPQDHAVKCAQASLARQLQIQTAFATGRLNIFQTMVSPDQVAAAFGPSVGVSAANLQADTVDARVSAWLYGDGSAAPLQSSGMAPVNVPTPTTYPLNRGGGCLTRPNQVRTAAQKPVMPTPGKVKQAPLIIGGIEPPIYQTTGGLTGYAPPWSDAFVQRSGSGNGNNDMGVVAWIQQNPWLSLALAAGGLFAVSKGGRRR